MTLPSYLSPAALRPILDRVIGAQESRVRARVRRILDPWHAVRFTRRERVAWWLRRLADRIDHDRSYTIQFTLPVALDRADENDVVSHGVSAMLAMVRELEVEKALDNAKDGEP